MNANATIDVRGMPEVIYAVRREMAKLLESEAEIETNPMVAYRLREIAKIFLAGVKL